MNLQNLVYKVNILLGNTVLKQSHREGKGGGTEVGHSDQGTGMFGQRLLTTVGKSQNQQHLHPTMESMSSSHQPEETNSELTHFPNKETLLISKLTL